MAPCRAGRPAASLARAGRQPAQRLPPDGAPLALPHTTDPSQAQKWFLLEFLGTDAEIDITGCSHPEFSAYSWQQLADLPPHVVDFKQGVYRQVR